MSCHLSNVDKRDQRLDDTIRSLFDATIWKNHETLYDTTIHNNLLYDQGNSSMCVSDSLTWIKCCQDNVVNLNPSFLYNLRSDQHSDGGMSVREALTIAHRYGIPDNDHYKINTPIITSAGDLNHVHSITRETLDNASKHRILEFGRIYSPDTVKDVIELSKLYGNQCFGAVEIVMSMSTLINLYKGSDNQSPENDSYHALAIKDFDPITESFLIQNSWGPQFQNQSLSYSQWYDKIVECWFVTSEPIVSSALKKVASYISPFDGFVNVDNSSKGEQRQTNGYLQRIEQDIKGSNIMIQQEVAGSKTKLHKSKQISVDQQFQELFNHASDAWKIVLNCWTSPTNRTIRRR